MLLRPLGVNSTLALLATGSVMTHIEKMRLQAALQALRGTQLFAALLRMNSLQHALVCLMQQRKTWRAQNEKAGDEARGM